MKFEFVQMNRKKKKKTQEVIITMHEVSRNSCMVMACHALELRNSVHHAKIKLIKKELCVV